LDHVRTRGSEASVSWRVDSELLAPRIHGAFVDVQLGLAMRRSRFELTHASNDESLLLGGFAFGAYHGDPTQSGGETRIYYDHRHDGYAAGLLSSGLGSGAPGHLGLDVQHFFSPTWGVHLNSELGATWVLGLRII